MVLDDLVNKLDAGAAEDEILPLITEESAQEADPDGCACRCTTWRARARRDEES